MLQHVKAMHHFIQTLTAHVLYMHIYMQAVLQLDSNQLASDRNRHPKPLLHVGLKRDLVSKRNFRCPNATPIIMRGKLQLQSGHRSVPAKRNSASIVQHNINAIFVQYLAACSLFEADLQLSIHQERHIFSSGQTNQ